jgi:hypothetical protein
MKKGESTSAEAAELRRCAETRLRTKAAGENLPRTEVDMRRLLHELQVHQVELEMQNEELLRTREELEVSRNKYADLYDFAPVGYFTFDVRTDTGGKSCRRATAGNREAAVGQQTLYQSYCRCGGEGDFFQSPRKCSAKAGHAEM